LEFFAKAFEFFGKSGTLGWAIFICSLVSGAIIIERLWTYYRAAEDGDGWFDELLEKVGAGKRDGDSLSDVSHPSARVLSAMLDKLGSMGGFSRGALEKTANHHGRREVRELERYLGALSTIANVAPLLGLAGTVLGMVKAFQKIEALEGKVNAAVLAGGIWEALLTTLFGLAVAIPTVIAHNYLASRASNVAAQIQDQAVALVDALEESEDKDAP